MKSAQQARKRRVRGSLLGGRVFLYEDSEFGDLFEVWEAVSSEAPMLKAVAIKHVEVLVISLVELG